MLGNDRISSRGRVPVCEEVGLDRFPVHGPAYGFVEQGEYFQTRCIGKSFNVCFSINHSFLSLFSTYCCRNPRDQPTSYRPRFLLIEEPGSGQASDLAAAVIHSLEKFPIYTLDTPTLFASTLPDETCVQVAFFLVSLIGLVYKLVK